MELNEKRYCTDPDERLSMIINSLGKQGSRRLKVAVYLGNKEFMNADISALELSNRSDNAMKRNGFLTVGDLVRKISGRESLKALRNVGDKSADEIMEKLLRFKYSVLSGENREKYIERIKEINMQNLERADFKP